MSFTVGVAGITGKFARSVVANLLKHPDVNIRGYARNPSKLPSTISTSPRVQLTQGDANDTNALRSFTKGTNVVICCYLGDNQLMIDGQKRLIDACEAEGVKRYIASDYTLDYTKLELGKLPPKDPMKHVKAYLDTKKVKGVHMFNGIFMETLWSRFFGLWNESQTSFSYWGSGEEIWESTSYGTMSEYVAEAALDDTAVGVQQFLGDRKNIHQIAEVFESVYGKKPKLQNLGSLDDLYKHMHKIKEENPTNIYAWMPLFYHYYCLNGQANLSRDLDNKKYAAIKPVTFEDFLKSHTLEELGVAQDTVGANI